MATRKTTHVLKNSDIVNRPLPSSLLAGEPIVNTAEGIVYFSGVTSSITSGWTQSGSGSTFWEVGSNLYDLRLRNKITAYNDLTDLTGKFLSGTTNGFELAEISSIVGVDTYVTGFSYTDNVITLSQTSGGPTKTVLIDTMTGLTINGTLSATTANVGTLSATNGTVSTNASSDNDIVNYQTLTSYTQTNDVYVTGGTFTDANDNSNVVSMNLSYHGTPLSVGTLNGKDTFTTGGTYNNSTKLINFVRNDGTTGYTVDLSYIDVNDTYVTGGTITTSPSNNNISGETQLAYNNPEIGNYYLPFTDVFVTGFTYDDNTNTFTISDNSGNTFSKGFTSVSGLSVGNLTTGRVVYVGTSGLLTDKAGFEYNDSQDKLLVSNLAVNNTTSAATFSTGGVVIGSGGSYGVPGTGDLTVHGALTVFGPTISAFTSELYVEDSNIIINYNPSGTSSGTSLGAGFTIQDGEGSGNGDVVFQLTALNTLTGNTGNPKPSVDYSTEYPSNDGYSNRGWITQLNDIVIRSSNISTPKGVRVLAEFDVLDGGTY